MTFFVKFLNENTTKIEFHLQSNIQLTIPYIHFSNYIWKSNADNVRCAME